MWNLSAWKQRRIGLEFSTITTKRKPPDSNAKANPGDEAVADILWQLLIVDQLLQENAAKMQTEEGKITARSAHA